MVMLTVTIIGFLLHILGHERISDAIRLTPLNFIAKIYFMAYNLPIYLEIPMAFIVSYLISVLILLDFRLIDYVFHGGNIMESHDPLTYRKIFKRAIVMGVMLFALYILGSYF